MHTNPSATGLSMQFINQGCRTAEMQISRFTPLTQRARDKTWSTQHLNTRQREVRTGEIRYMYALSMTSNHISFFHIHNFNKIVSPLFLLNYNPIWSILLRVRPELVTCHLLSSVSFYLLKHINLILIPTLCLFPLPLPPISSLFHLHNHISV